MDQQPTLATIFETSQEAVALETCYTATSRCRNATLTGSSSVSVQTDIVQP